MLNVHGKSFTDDQIIHQCNLIHAAERYGYTCDSDVRELAVKLLQGDIAADHPVNRALEQYGNVRRTFMRHLERTLKPLLFGISRKWRKTQEELLLATLRSLDRGYIRPLSEIPTGGGKSMFIGAIVRAALDTMRELHLDQEIHIFTSRIAIAGQLIYEEVHSEEAEDRPLDLGRTGDVRIWCRELTDDNIRLLAGKKGQSSKEIGKNSVLTVSTYQGLRAGRIADHFKKPAFITICDEQHRVTERVAILLEQMKSMVMGMSATVIGPNRDPFFFFERIERPEVSSTQRKTYIHHLNYYKSIAEMVKDQELKPVRWINARSVKINVSEAELRSSVKSVYDVFNDTSISRILSKNPSLMAEVIAEAYLGEHEGLILTGSTPLYKRRGIAFVDRIATARTSMEECNKILPEKLLEKYGESSYFKAGYVDGTMSEDEYNSIISKFRAGEITLLFSAEKVGEGVDLPFVNLIIPLRPLGFGSQWKLKQNLGRGTRIDPANPLDDLVVLDMVFISDRHLLASVLGIFGQSSILSGGLLAGWHTNYELEAKVFDLLKKCKTWTDVWNKMTPEEQIQFPFIREKMLEEKARSSQHHELHEKIRDIRSIFSLGSIRFVEQEDVRLALSLGNHEEMVKYTVETLVKEGYRSVDHLQSIHGNSLLMFSKRRFGRFRDGLTMVNLNLQESRAVLTNANMTSFIEIMRRAGLPERRSSRSFDQYAQQEEDQQPLITIQRRQPPPSGKQSSKKASSPIGHTKAQAKKVPVITTQSIDSLVAMTQDKFGVEPEFMSHPRDMHGLQPRYIAQAMIALPEGLKFSSPIKVSLDEDKAKLAAAAELLGIITEQIDRGHILLYQGSPWYENHLKVLSLLMHEHGYSEPFYTITERNNIFVIQASIEKYKGMKIVGTPVMNRDREVAKMHADVTLARQVTKTLVSFAESASVKAGQGKLLQLQQLCRQLKVEPSISNRSYTVRMNTVHEVTMRAMGVTIKAAGITIEHAKEKAAGHLYYELLQFIGGRQQNS